MTKEDKLTKEQQEVFDSIPKEIYKLPPQEFVSEFVQRIIDKVGKDVLVETVEKSLMKNKEERD